MFLQESDAEHRNGLTKWIHLPAPLLSFWKPHMNLPPSCKNQQYKPQVQPLRALNLTWEHPFDYQKKPFLHLMNSWNARADEPAKNCDLLHKYYSEYQIPLINSRDKYISHMKCSFQNIIWFCFILQQSKHFTLWGVICHNILFFLLWTIKHIRMCQNYGSISVRELKTCNHS